MITQAEIDAIVNSMLDLAIKARCIRSALPIPYLYPGQVYTVSSSMLSRRYDITISQSEQVPPAQRHVIEICNYTDTKLTAMDRYQIFEQLSLRLMEEADKARLEAVDNP